MLTFRRSAICAKVMSLSRLDVRHFFASAGVTLSIRPEPWQRGHWLSFIFDSCRYLSREEPSFDDPRLHRIGEVHALLVVIEIPSQAITAASVQNVEDGLAD